MSVTFKISGQKIQVQGSPSRQWEFTIRPGGWVIAEASCVNDKGETVRLRRRLMVHEVSNRLSLQLGQSAWWAECLQESVGLSQEMARDLQSELTAQFPGKIRKIRVEVNQPVESGEVLLLVEAMKMEFSIRAPSAGRVRKYLVVEGESVVPGTQFLEWEESSSEP
ncbi:MAG: acetyl-CoA carboxylase biotin carboxyl carrier protein subunit [Bdellovibrionia bacterium]